MLHSLLADALSILFDLVDSVLVWDVARLARVAVAAAPVHGGADFTVVVSSGSVDGASLVSDLVLSHPLEGVEGVSTVAAAILVVVWPEGFT